jgi:hypothetical protein
MGQARPKDEHARSEPDRSVAPDSSVDQLTDVEVDRLLGNELDPESDDAARGIIGGVLLGLAVWALLITVGWLLFSP